MASFSREGEPLFFNRDHEPILKPGFGLDSEPPRSGQFYIRLTPIATFKKSKKGTLYLSWPVELIGDAEGAPISGYQEVEWMLFFSSEEELLDLLVDKLKLDKPSLEHILMVYYGGTFIDGKEPIVLPEGYTHCNLLVDITPGFTDKHRNLRILKEPA